MLDILIVFLPLIGSIMAGIIVFGQAADKEKQHSLDMLAQWVTCYKYLITSNNIFCPHETSCNNGDNLYSQLLYKRLCISRCHFHRHSLKYS